VRNRVLLGMLTPSSNSVLEPVSSAMVAEARVKAICWNGTSAGWHGFDTDRAPCAAIERRTGVAASSSVLSLADAFRRTGVERDGLVTPHSDDIQAKILATFRKDGFNGRPAMYRGSR
jgi:maleate isomerase